MSLVALLRNRSASAAVEMALVTPLLLALMFGAVEVGNFFMSAHTLDKQVRDGARYASRLALTDTYTCPTAVFSDPDATTHIINVTKAGNVAGTDAPEYWNHACGTDTQTVTVTVTCVSKDDIDTEASGETGIYTGLQGDIPVVTVSARVKYQSVLAALGFSGANRCVAAQSQAAVQGI